MNDIATADLPAHLSAFDSADGRLAYRDTGSGPPVVLLHAGFLDHTMWDGQFDALAAAGHRVIAPDTRGHGWSANATRPFRWSDDLAGLLRHLGTGPAVLVGVSMGAAIAVETALDHPDLVRALVVSGGGSRVEQFREPWARELRATEVRALSAGDLDGWLDAGAYWAAGPRRQPGDLDPALKRRLREMRRRTILKHAPDEPDRLLPGPDTAGRAGEIAVPVLGVHGELDAPELTAVTERIVGAVPGGRTVTVHGAAHFPHLERPDAFNRIVAGFLAELPPPRG